jgi:hypothetical protein
MPFLLTNASATIQFWMNGFYNHSSVKTMTLQSVIPNDVLIAMKGTKEEHHEYVGKILQVLQDNELVVEIDKWNFDQPAVKFLGFLGSGEGLQMAPS